MDLRWTCWMAEWAVWPCRAWNSNAVCCGRGIRPRSGTLQNPSGPRSSGAHRC
ncbi:unnamed protein product, partial [Prorocentrum cordatum]